MLDLTFDEKEQVIESLKEAIPKMTRRQLECWILCQLGFTQEESAIILDLNSKSTVNEHLGNLWDILDKN